jgi:thiol-disulfide isomerase/thioredoxin
MKGVEMTGILIDSGFDKQDATIRERRMAMTSLGRAKTDQNGEYEIDLAPGTALVGAVRANHFSSPLIVRLDVDPENNKAISDIVLFPIPTLKGYVRTEDQQSASDVIVKMETRGRVDVKPVGRTDDAGDFQLRLPLIPYASYGLGFDTTAYIVAIDPQKQVGGIAEIDLTDPDQTSNIVVNMKPQSREWFLHPLGIGPETIARQTEYALAARENYSKGIKGNTVPPMSEGTWFNTDAKSLADFRGKFVLLDFWFIGCGPCEEAIPELKVAHQAFSSDQFAIVAVHANNRPAKEVREFVKQNDMPYAIVVDDRDGSIDRQYKPLGLSRYPEYILIDPDGRIVHNDAVLTGLIEGGARKYRSLRLQKQELVRAALQSWDWDAE